MTIHIILASGSEVRASLLRNAGLNIDIHVPRIDEESIREALLAESAKPRDVADTLAEMKARKISAKFPRHLTLGCDQVLDHQGKLLNKPSSKEHAAIQLSMLSGAQHSLFSAAVLYQNGEPVWRHVGQVRLRMRELSQAYITEYVDRNWDSIRHAVGCYKLEEEGVRLFTNIQGDYFTVLGLPLIDLLNYLSLKGEITP